MTVSLAFLFAGAAGVAATAGAATAGRRRLRLSRAKHRSLAGHARWSRRIARLIPAVTYGDARFFAADGAPPEIVLRRRAAFDRLAALFAERYPRGRALTAETRAGLSDLQFTGRYRVPPPFAERVAAQLGTGAFMAASEGVTLTDIDGNRFVDLTGSFGVNLLGLDAYKALMDQAVAVARPLGPLLGSYHPIVADNVARLRALTGLDEVSFHMSGTEAVMQAVRLAQYHTGREKIVRFCGAYHGWWGDVQPGVGNPVSADRTYTLAEMSDRTLRTLATRRDIACVLVNGLQAMHPNGAAPSDNMLIDGARRSGVGRDAYAEWLGEVARVCRDRGIVLILDEVFTGFRLAKGGAAEYYGVRPDLITYGKTLGGGFPIGVVCGKAALMRRYRDDRPADICFARGTFNAHPYVMAAMNAFLRHIEGSETAALYDGLDGRWRDRAALLNDRLAAAGLPVRVEHLVTIFQTLYTQPSRYHWMLQYYLRAEGLALSWIGSGRLIFNLAFDDAAFADVCDGFVAAAGKMQADGWWWRGPDMTAKSLKLQVLRELLQARLGRT